MEQLKMQSKDLVQENVKKIAELFPNAVTEIKVKCLTGNKQYSKIVTDTQTDMKYAIDFDVLRQELSDYIVEGKEERYQFTWPNKKNAILNANVPTNNTLRPLINESNCFYNTKNIYIEGDNFEVLKLLRETYLEKINLIYIDPPYNTGGDFVYNDNFKESIEEYIKDSNQIDDEGNKLVQNTERNGRFHTDWLNMMYSRLKVAKDLLSEKGLIFISIGDEELDNLRKIANEIFGEENFRNQIVIRRGAKSVQAQFDTWDKLGQGVEYILMYSKQSDYRFPKQMKKLDKIKCGGWNNHWRGTDRPTMRYEIFGITPSKGQWRWSRDRSIIAIDNYKRMQDELGYNDKDYIEQNIIDEWYKKQGHDIDLLRLSATGKPEHYIPPTNETVLNNSWDDLLVGSSSEIKQLFEEKVFDTAKLTSFIKRILQFAPKDSIVLDFFSGSATTAQAVMSMNAEDDGNRKYIMVQIPEKTNEKSEAYKSGYKNICQIGKERISRASNAIRQKTGKEIDYGVRILKLDSSNMKDIYYNPSEIQQQSLFDNTDNIKEDRTPEDLLFQVMLDLGVMLSSKIEERIISGKKIFIVEDGFLIACFDKDVTDETVKAVAMEKPYYAVFRDSCMANDSVATNFEQIFATYSPDTVRKVL